MRVPKSPRISSVFLGPFLLRTLYLVQPAGLNQGIPIATTTRVILSRVEEPCSFFAINSRVKQSMKKNLALVLLSMAIAVPAFAQVENNKIDVSGGYILRRADGVTSNGWYGEVGHQVYKAMYVLGAVAGTYSSSPLEGTPVEIDTNSHSFVGGVRIFSRYFKQWSPFADALVGGYHAHADTPDGVSPAVRASLNGFVVSLGLGIDFRFRDSLSVRARPSYNFVGVQGRTEGQASIQAGIVWHLGR
jgi:hypothetical protein